MRFRVVGALSVIVAVDFMRDAVVLVAVDTGGELIRLKDRYMGVWDVGV